MIFISWHFFWLMLVAFYFYNKWPREKWVKIILPFLNIAFIVSLFQNPVEVIPFVIFLVMSFVFVKVIEKHKTPVVLNTIVTVILFFFLYLKQYPFMSAFPLIKWNYFIVGLSYILFRVIHLIIDIYDGQIKEKISGMSFYNYTCFFLSFLSGPIQRYQDYKMQEQKIEKDELSIEKKYKYFSRIIDGYIKVSVLAALLNTLYSFCWYNVSHYKVYILVILFYIGACVTYLAYVYFNFSGYMDIVIGFVNFLGFKLPENFDYPFSSECFLEFWTKWHMTLSEWFKVYVFNPFMKKLLYKWPNPKLTHYYGVIAYFMTFFLVGAWHGSTVSMLIFGILLGLGVSVNKLYEVLLIKKLGKKKFTNIHNSIIVRIVGSAYTYSYFCVITTCFWLNISEVKELLSNIGLSGVIMSFILGGIFIIGWKIIYSLFSFILRQLSERLLKAGKGDMIQQATLSIKFAILIMFFILMKNNVPEFVYQGF